MGIRYIKLDDNNELKFAEDILKFTKLEFDELQELVKTKQGQKEVIDLLASEIEKNPKYSFYAFLGLLCLIGYVEDDEITKKYLLDNETIYNRIVNKRDKYYSFVTSIFPKIKSDTLKGQVLEKYLSIFKENHWKYGERPYHDDRQALIKIIFSFELPDNIKKYFTNKEIRTLLNYKKMDSQWKIIEEIESKKTKKKKRKCIIPEVLTYLDPCQISRPIISIEDDSIKKECINNSDIRDILLGEDRYYSYAYIVASFKDGKNIDDAIEEGLERYLDGQDLAIMISARKGDAKKTEYRNNSKIKSELNFEQEAKIVESYDEEKADEEKYNFIINTITRYKLQVINILPEKFKNMLKDSFHVRIREIICSMKDQMKLKCLSEKVIMDLLYFDDICMIVNSLENEEEKFMFIKNNINEINAENNFVLRKLVLSLSAKYKRACLNDEDISFILNFNQENDECRLTICDIISSDFKYSMENYAYRGKEKYQKLSEDEKEKALCEEDSLKNEYLEIEKSNPFMTDYCLIHTINTIHNQEFKIEWIIYFASIDRLEWDEVYDMLEGIDRDKYQIKYDEDGVKPISYIKIV